MEQATPAYFFDASVAVKVYGEEEGSDLAEEILDRGAEVYLSRLGVVEVAAAFFRKTKTGQMEVEDALSAVEDLRADVNDVYQIVEVSPATADRAIEVAKRHRLRVCDCLQLATALLLREQRDALGFAPLTFASSDRELGAAARAEGLAVEDPASS